MLVLLMCGRCLLTRIRRDAILINQTEELLQQNYVKAWLLEDSCKTLQRFEMNGQRGYSQLKIQEGMDAQGPERSVLEWTMMLGREMLDAFLVPIYTWLEDNCRILVRPIPY
jgi:hypothetical protein